ncbi:MAG: acetate/propionate family kinase [Dehalococcoidia bacterium]
MAAARRGQILTINTGSSSLRAACFQCDAAGRDETLVFSAEAERIGASDARLRILDAAGKLLSEQQAALPDHAAGVQAVFAWLQQEQPGATLDAVGHRIVHGGSRYSEPRRITPELIDAVQKLVPIDPDHLPQALAAIRFVSQSYPELQQVACFDTAFHRQMPRVARLYALPRRLTDAGLVRYGFHGLSYEFIMQQLRTEAGAAASGRIIIAHLGNGASMAAVRNGTGIDTTMGFTPTGGLVMGSRSGDLDPGVLLYLLQERGLTPAALSTLLNKQSGLLGVSGSSGDMRDLIRHESADPHAAEAIELFCYQARKFVGALSAALGGLDMLVFTAGIGERSAEVRRRVCEGLKFLGVEIDPDRNEAHAPIVSRDSGGVVVRVMHTDENRMIARHTARVIAGGEGRGDSHVSV